MLTKTLRVFSSAALLIVAACGSGEPGGTDPGSTGSSEPATTGTSTGETPTSTETPTTDVSTTGGVSESLSGTTGGTTTDATTGGLEGSTGTTGEPGETGTSTGDEPVETTGEPAPPVSFDECRMGDAAMCPAEDPACLTVDGPGGFEPNGSFFVSWSYCTRECEADADCVSAMQGGTAKALCVPKGPNMVKVCVLDCSFGKTCPDALECSYDDTCGTRFCECEGTGCQDMLCTG